jgi:hypothetical protein
MSFMHGADAAFATNIPPGFEIAFGYYGGPSAYHVWTAEDWQRFPGLKVPIWVAGADGSAEGQQAVQALRTLRVPERSVTVVDMETAVNSAYLDRFGAELNAAGFGVWVYGSADTVFENPRLDGYWVADYTGQPFMHPRLGVRATQYAANLPPGYDVSLVKAWTGKFMWR